MVFVERSVNSVCSGLGDEADNTARGVTGVRIRIVGGDAEFIDGVLGHGNNRRNRARFAIRRGVVVRAFEIAGGIAAIDGKRNLFAARSGDLAASSVSRHDVGLNGWLEED